MGTRARKGTSSVVQAAQGVGARRRAGRHPRSEPGDLGKPPRLSAELEALLDEADEYAELADHERDQRDYRRRSPSRQC